MTVVESAILVLLALSPFGLGLFILWPSLAAKRRSRENPERERAACENVKVPVEAPAEGDHILQCDPGSGGGRMALTTYLILRAQQRAASPRGPHAL